VTLGDLMAAQPTPIVNLTRGTVVCEHAIIADRALPRMRGLLGRRSLPGGEGILLRPAPSIHTAFMRFPIDVIFLDRDLHVVKLVETLGPWRMASARRAHAALEIAAGEAVARGIEIGDSLGLVADTVSASETGSNGGAPQPQMPAGAADTLRVLLVGKDRRFRSVTSALLTGRGCAVTLGERLDVAMMRADRESPDVVVIDADSSPVAARFEAAHLQTFDPPVGVVIISGARDAPAPAVPVLAKWGPFEQLYSAVTAARPDHDWRRSNG
jgi:uncharacterized membrane protein (UPF0127 family)